MPDFQKYKQDVIEIESQIFSNDMNASVFTYYNQYNLTQRFGHAVRGLLNNSVKKYPFERNFQNFLKLAENKEGFVAAIATAIERGAGLADLSILVKQTAKNPTEIQNIPKIIQDYLKNNPSVDGNMVYGKITSAMSANIFNEINYDTNDKKKNVKSEPKVAKLLSKLEGMFTKEELDEMTPEGNVYEDALALKNTDVFPHKDEIEALKLEHPSEADKKILDDANYYLREIKPMEHSDLGDIAEHAGYKSNDVLRDISLKEIDGSNPEIKNHIKKNRSAFFIEQDNDYENNVKNIMKYKGELPEAFKKEVAEMVKVIEETEIFDYNDYQNNYTNVHGNVFNRMIQARKNLADAVKSKNMAEIKKHTQTCAKYENIYGNLMNRMNVLDDSGIIISNVSISRGERMPAFIKADIIGNSRMVTLYYLSMIKKETGLEVKDILDNPVESYKKALKIKSFGKASDADKFCSAYKNDLKTFILKSYNEKEPEMEEMKRKGNAVVVSIQEGIISICGMNPSADKGKLTAPLLTLKDNVLENYVSFINGDIFYSASHKNGKDFFANAMVLNADDFNVKNLCPAMEEFRDVDTLKPLKSLNIDDYLAKKADFAQVAMRIDEVNSLTNKQRFNGTNTLKDAITMVIGKVRTSPKEKSSTVTRALNNLERGESINPTDVITLKAESAFNSKKGKYLESFNLKETIQAIADLQKEYSNRNFFARILYSSVRNQNAAINSMKEVVTKAGVHEKELDDILDAMKAGNESEVNKLIESAGKDVDRNLNDILEARGDEAPEQENITQLDVDESVLGDEDYSELDGQKMDLNMGMEMSKNQLDNMLNK